MQQGGKMKQITCMYCGEDLPGAEKSIGKTVRCPACKHKMRIRAPAPAKPQPRKEHKSSKAAAWDGKSDAEIAEQLLVKAPTKGRQRQRAKAPTAEERRRQAVRKHLSPLLPRYDDLTLFALSLTFLLLFAANADLRETLADVVVWTRRGDVLILLGAAALGMVFSLFNVFLKREKSKFEKLTMLIFAVGVTAGTGVYAGYIMLKQSPGPLMIFPVWNIINGGLLLLLFHGGVVDTSCIADTKAGLLQIGVTVVSLAILLALCQYTFRLHWSISFSIAVGYTMSLLGGLRDVFGLRPCDEQE